MTTSHPQPPHLFPPFRPELWNSSNDSLRGGLSTSSLSLASPSSPDASPLLFTGNINSKPLGAGFASQYFTWPAPGLNLTSYSAFSANVQNRSEGAKKLTFVLRDDVESGVSFEAHVSLAAGEKRKAVLDWSEFRGSRRGRDVDGTLDRTKVRRLTVMVRSFFSEEGQEGEFKIVIGEVRVCGEEDGGVWCEIDALDEGMDDGSSAIGDGKTGSCVVT